MLEGGTQDKVELFLKTAKRQQTFYHINCNIVGTMGD